MTNKFGQKYFCMLPKSDNDDSEGDDIIDENGQKSKSPIKTVNGPAKIPELLLPMITEPCLVKTKDWWTYEVCYQKVAKQYHLEGENDLQIYFNGKWMLGYKYCHLCQNLHKLDFKFVILKKNPCLFEK